MSLQPFSFRFPQTRFLKAGGYIYKLKIQGGSTHSGGKTTGEYCYNQELEDIIRTVLGNLESLQPFSSTHFNVFPYKKQWEGVTKVMCKLKKKKLKAYPFTLILFLEKIWHNDPLTEDQLTPEKDVHLLCVCEPPFKRHKSDSPLEESIIKDLANYMEAESKVSVMRLYEHNSLQQEDTEEDPQSEDKGSDVIAVTESGTPEDNGEETIGAEKTPAEPNRLTKLARRIFPISLFFRDT